MSENKTDENDMESAASTNETAPENIDAATSDNAEGIDDNDDDGIETVIRDTDIVFDCPHCGHNLAIDYRGAGLQINCVNCGETVLVPIPKEMKIDDLDLEPGEILKQLFATRRNLQRAEAHAEELEGQVYELTARINAMWAKCETLTMQLGELRSHCHQQAANNEKMTDILDHMAAELQQPQQTSEGNPVQTEEEEEEIEGEASAE